MLSVYLFFLFLIFSSISFAAAEEEGAPPPQASAAVQNQQAQSTLERLGDRFHQAAQKAVASCRGLVAAVASWVSPSADADVDNETLLTLLSPEEWQALPFDDDARAALQALQQRTQEARADVTEAEERVSEAQTTRDTLSAECDRLKTERDHLDGLLPRTGAITQEQRTRLSSLVGVEIPLAETRLTRAETQCQSSQRNERRARAEYAELMRSLNKGFSGVFVAVEAPDAAAVDDLDLTRSVTDQTAVCAAQEAEKRAQMATEALRNPQSSAAAALVQQQGQSPVSSTIRSATPSSASDVGTTSGSADEMGTLSSPPPPPPPPPMVLTAPSAAALPTTSLLSQLQVPHQLRQQTAAPQARSGPRGSLLEEIEAARRGGPGALRSAQGNGQPRAVFRLPVRPTVSTTTIPSDGDEAASIPQQAPRARTLQVALDDAFSAVASGVQQRGKAAGNNDSDEEDEEDVEWAAEQPENSDEDDDE